MAKDDIRKLLDEAKRSLESEYEDQKNTIKTELQTFKTKALDKIQKNIP